MDLYKVEVSCIIRFIKEQGFTFLLINVYLFLEYVRPQTLYPSIDIFPFAKTTIVVTLLFFILQKKELLVSNIQNKLIILFLVVILMSSYNAMSSSIALQRVPDFIAWMIIYFLIINIVNTPGRIFIFIFAFLLYSFKMAQFSFFKWVSHGFSFLKDGSGGGPGWFKNSGEFGIQMCIFLAYSACFIQALKEYWPRWKKIIFLSFPVTALSGTISCSSRGAVLGGAGVVMYLLLCSKHKVKGLIAVCAIVTVAFVMMPQQQLERFKTAGEDSTSISRIQLWDRGLELVKKYPVLGVGYRNWGVAQQEHFGLDNQLLPHNIFLECATELGYTGLAVFMLMVVFTFANNRRTRAMVQSTGKSDRFIYYMTYGSDAALVGYLISGFFVTVLYYPYFWINLSMTVALNNVASRYTPDEAKTASLEFVETRGDNAA